jgi:hypothetical protein
MAKIAQPLLFGWEEIETLGDLSRLELVLGTLPDEELMQALEQKRGRGRDDYPVRAMWNSLLAGIVFQHPSVDSLRRELSRNAQLRLICGFNPCRGEKQACPDLHRGCTCMGVFPLSDQSAEAHRTGRGDLQQADLAVAPRTAGSWSVSCNRR